MKTLFFDIETAPMRGLFWDLFETNPLEVEEVWYLLSFSFKWNDGRVRTYALPDFRSYNPKKPDDKALVKKLWELMNEADLCIGHNGDKFDIKKANARFIYHGLTPPAPYKTVDTLKIARRYFKFDSNRLDYIGHYLGLGRKLPHTGKHLWLACMRGDKKAWALMKKYNAQDVVLLEKVYKRFLPWITNHPWVNPTGCPNCGSHHLQSRGTQRNKSKVTKRLQCQDCGAWKSEPLDKDEKSRRKS